MSTFHLDVRKFVEKTKGNAHAIVGKIVLDIGTRIVERSPVRTGRFRANWQYATVGAGIPSGTLDETDPSGERTLSRLMTGIGSEPAGYIHVLVNNLPYAERLENGWSKQAPSGMVGITVVEFQSLVDQVVTENGNK